MRNIYCYLLGHKNIKWKDVGIRGENSERNFIDQTCLCERCKHKTRKTTNIK